MPFVDFDAHEHRWLQWSPYWKMAGVYVIKGTVRGWFGGESAYAGLSRNIAKRFESHRAEAAAGTHTNDDLQRPIQEAGPTLSFSVNWVCRRDWNRGGNYECTLAERRALPIFFSLDMPSNWTNIPTISFHKAVINQSKVIVITNCIIHHSRGRFNGIGPVLVALRQLGKQKSIETKHFVTC